MNRFLIPTLLLVSFILSLPLRVNASNRPNNDGMSKYRRVILYQPLGPYGPPVVNVNDQLMDLIAVEDSRPVRFYLYRADAESTAKKLTRRFSDENGVQIWFDKSNTIWIKADNDQIRRARVYVERLDERKRYQSCHIIRLEHLNAVLAVQLVTFIQMVATSFDDEYDVYVVPSQNKARNDVILSGPDEEQRQVMQWLRWLDGRGK